MEVAIGLGFGAGGGGTTVAMSIPTTLPPVNGACGVRGTGRGVTFGITGEGIDLDTTGATATTGVLAETSARALAGSGRVKGVLGCSGAATGVAGETGGGMDEGLAESVGMTLLSVG